MGGGHGWAGHGAGRGFAAGPAVELPWGLASGRERGSLLRGNQACLCLLALTSPHVSSRPLSRKGLPGGAWA